MSTIPSQPKTSMLVVYIVLTLCLCAGVALFTLLYQGSGADMLRNPDAEFNEALQNQTAMEIDATPAPTAAPVAVSLTGRIIPYYSDALWGYKNTLGQVVIQPAFINALEFADGVAFAQTPDGLYGLLSVHNVWLVEPVWTNVLPFSDGYAAVEQGGKWGYIDQTGKVMIDYIFREAGSFHCGRAMARSGSAYGYIDILGNFAVSTKWRKAGDFSEDLAFATSDEYEKDRQYIINKVGEKVATLGSSVKGDRFSEGFAAVVEDGSVHYYMNATGRSAFQNTYLDAKAFSNGLAAVRTADGWGYINTLGSFEIPAKFMAADSFSADGLAAVQDAATGKWGYVTKRGHMAIAAEYDAAQPFSGGFSIAAKGAEYYLVDTEGKAKLFYTR